MMNTIARGNMALNMTVWKAVSSASISSRTFPAIKSDSLWGEGRCLNRAYMDRIGILLDIFVDRLLPPSLHRPIAVVEGRDQELAGELRQFSSQLFLKMVSLELMASPLHRLRRRRDQCPISKGEQTGPDA